MIYMWLYKVISIIIYIERENTDERPILFPSRLHLKKLKKQCESI